jgi:hypothetical protein
VYNNVVLKTLHVILLTKVFKRENRDKCETRKKEKVSSSFDMVAGPFFIYLFFLKLDAPG